MIMRKFSKIVFSMLLLLSMLICFFTASACGNNNKNENDNTNPAGAVNGADAEQEATKKISGEEKNMSFEEIYQSKIKEFEKNPHPVAVIVMENKEAIVFELYEDIAKNSVLNFISLANSGFYDGIIFHRVIDNFMIQTGDPLGNGTGGPGYTIKGEFSNNDFSNNISHLPGVVSMARQGNPYNPKAAYNTAGSQFFICVGSPTYLDGDYAAFGKVIDGMDTVNSIAKVTVDGNDKPLEDQKMAYVRVDTHGVAYAEPETIAE